MATIYPRKGSPFWWIKYLGPDGRPRQESTKFRTESTSNIRRARRLKAEKDLAEFDGATANTNGAEQWETWVLLFLQQRYAASPLTLERYLYTWDTLQKFLIERKIIFPRQLTRRHCFDYMAWRQHPAADRRADRHNTALQELKTLRIIMHKAMTNDFCTRNPCCKLGIKKQSALQKPEMTDELIETIRHHITETQPSELREFLNNSFEIARYQGCRISETRVNPQTDVALNKTNSTIRWAAKGGKNFTTLLHHKLISLFEQLKADGRTATWTAPRSCATEQSRRSWASSCWSRFLRKHGLRQKFPGLCFHSTRVTVITRMVRNNVTASKAKHNVGHSSTLVHETYQRLKTEDLAECVQAV